MKYHQIIICILSVYLFSCERSFKQSEATLTLQTPLTALSQKVVQQSSTPLSGDLNSLDEVTCYAVFFHGPEAELRQNSCYQSTNQSASARPVGQIVGTARAGESFTIQVPSGKDRVFALVGFKSVDNYCPNLLTEKIDRSKITKPYLLGEAGGVSLSPGENKSISLKMTFDKDKWFDECKGPQFDIILRDEDQSPEPSPIKQPTVLPNIGHPSAIAFADDGMTMVIGDMANSTDENGSDLKLNAGAVFVFSKINGVWSFQQKIARIGMNSRYEGDMFGNSLAISGDTLVVGAKGQDFDSSGGTNLTNAGAVYVFVRSGSVWTQQQKITPSGMNSRVASDEFGSSVAISGDTLVVGSLKHSFDGGGYSNVSMAGAVFAFTRTGGVWSQQQKIIPTGVNARVASDYFGNSLALSGDTLAVGSKGQDFDSNGVNAASGAGAVYIFTRASSVWSLQEKLVASGTNARNSNDEFGSSVGLFGDTLVVGAAKHAYDLLGSIAKITAAGGAFIFVRSGSTWSLHQKLIAFGVNGRNANDGFATSLAIGPAGIIVGSPMHDFDENGETSISNAGAVYTYTRNGIYWSEHEKIVATAPGSRGAEKYFGSSVCLAGSAAQPIIGIGSSGVANSIQGDAYIFDY